MAEFLGLHLDIDAIAKKNKADGKAHRKAGLIVNQGDKLTTEEKKTKQAANQILYGLTPEQVKEIKLPAPTAVQIFSVSKIVHAKVRLTTIEKIEHLLELEKALLEKSLKIREMKAKAKAKERTSSAMKKLEPTSDIEENEEETKQA